MFDSERTINSINRILQIIVLAYQGIVLAAFLVIPFLAMRWLQMPFLGAFVEQTQVFNGVGAGREDTAWQLFQQVLLKDQLVQVDGIDIHSTSDLESVLRRSDVGDDLLVTVEAPDGTQRTIIVTLHRFPNADRLLYLFIPYGVGLIFLVISLWIFGLRRNERAGRAFALFASSVALASAALFDLYTTHMFSLLWTLALCIAAGALIDLAMVFPQEMRRLVNRSYWGWPGYLVGMLLTSLAAFNLNNDSKPAAYIANWQMVYGFVGISVLIFAGTMIYRRLTASSPVVRQQANTILWGMSFAFGPLAAFFLLASFVPLNFPPFLLLGTVIFPTVTGYGVLRQRLLRTDFMVRQGVLYALLTVLMVAGYALLASGLSLVFQGVSAASSPVILGITAFGVAILLLPLRNRLQQVMDAVFFRGVRAYEQRMQHFSHELTNTVDQTAIVRTLRNNISQSLLPEKLHIYTYDPLNEQYTAAAGEDGRPTSDLRFTTSSPLVRLLKPSQVPVFFDGVSIPLELKPEQTRLDLLSAQLFVPMAGAENPIGWLALGPRRSGETYTSQDLTFLDQISTAAAVAIERAQVIFNLERRVREMNILARVAQGINITVIFDDILELIYAQTDQILPVDDFQITLYNKENDYFYYAFCVERDERLASRENLPLPPGTGLSPEVIRSRRPILSADYIRECQLRDATPFSQGIRAWVGVPLNAGAETIGALSVGSRDPDVVYTNGQQELLQSIAEQTAGAIVKARLLQESERRARQLAILNDITRQLTGTLETEPLLQMILESAVTILNCEAGSLFLVDDQTDELVFKLTVGPPASASLVGQRLPAGSGIVGRAVTTRLPVIENDAEKSRLRFTATDNQTGFVSRSLLAVPMQVKEHVIGVLEVINRKDGLPFVDDDQNLLSAFAGQAAVAIDNARLYTLTDLELNDRVEELSVMQRIDRELNASLDVRRAMRLTLEWAMRQSNMDAGLIGILEGKGMRIMAQQGYEQIEQTYKEAPMPLEQSSMRTAIQTSQPQRIALDDQLPGLLAGARTQTVIPIRREATVIGLIVMESHLAEVQSGQALTFLTRLSDHAAIAIANAQLYNEVQMANEAKSEFVSFVAHELKNPMTSIKGYTELLAKGAVGSITDMQANFLSTIHSNIERMSTLVSDLNDNSKIEAGKLRLDYKAIEVAEVVDEVMRSTKRQMDDKKQSLKIEISPKLPKIWADRTRLAQILTNLVSNAHKYTPESGIVSIGAEKGSNPGDPESTTEVVHVWVKDNGIGISIEDQKKIFQKFFRSDDSKAREVPGTGLGLNITRSLIEMMGGRVWFESEYRQGTIFHFTVPVAEE